MDLVSERKKQTQLNKIQEEKIKSMEENQEFTLEVTDALVKFIQKLPPEYRKDWMKTLPSEKRRKKI